MKKKTKIPVEALKVQSFVTTVEKEGTRNVKAGGSLKDTQVCVYGYSTLLIICGSC